MKVLGSLAPALLIGALNAPAVADNTGTLGIPEDEALQLLSRDSGKLTTRPSFFPKPAGYERMYLIDGASAGTSVKSFGPFETDIVLHTVDYSATTDFGPDIRCRVQMAPSGDLNEMNADFAFITRHFRDIGGGGAENGTSRLVPGLVIPAGAYIVVEIEAYLTLTGWCTTDVTIFYEEL